MSTTSRLHARETKAAVVALVFILYSFAGCSQNRFGRIAEPQRFKIVYTVPFVNNDGMVKIANDSFFVCYLDKTILYQLPYLFTMENDTGITSIKIKYNYFVYNKGASEGYFYDSIDVKASKKVSVDSIMRSKRMNVGQLYDPNSDVLVATSRDNENYSLIETYVSKIKNDPTYPDTSLFYYKSNIKDIDFSFSNQLDSIKRLKVCRVILIHKSQVYPGHTFQAPRREFLFDLEEAPSGHSNDLLFLYNRFRMEWAER